MGECRRSYRIRDTILETIHYVTTTHVNPLGSLHGGNALKWMVTAATMTSMRILRGYTVLAGLDNVFFINPVRLGEYAVIRGWIDYAGRSSLDLTIMVEAEDPVRGERRLTTVSHMTMVNVGEDLKPRPHGVCITPGNRSEEELYEAALNRRRTRPGREERARYSRDTTIPRPLVEGAQASTYHLVNPEDTIAYNVMHAGRLLYLMDELAGVTGIKYARGIVVTGSVDATSFYTPVRVGEILHIHSALTYIGRSSMEITVKAIVENPVTGRDSHITTSYFTMIHIGPEGRSLPLPQYRPEGEWQETVWRQALERRERRMQRLKLIKQTIEELKEKYKDVW